mgnify:CR=1 FL=1
MARKDAIAKLRMVLLGRRDALRKALDGEFSALQALRDQASGDVVDFALDSAQDELNSQLAGILGAGSEIRQGPATIPHEFLLFQRYAVAGFHNH